MPKPFLVRDLQATKYPDPTLMRFFFKERLFEAPGNVLEFGCGSANNLLLFGHYSWQVQGIEKDEMIVIAGEENLETCGIDGRIHCCMLPTIPFEISECGPYDALVMCGIMNYLSRADMCKALERAAPLLAERAWIFIQLRGMSDYRHHRGEEVGKNSFILDTSETGEEGCLNVCYHEWEVMDMLREYLSLDAPNAWVLHIHFENKLLDHHMLNHDIAIWGRRKA